MTREGLSPATFLARAGRPPRDPCAGGVEGTGRAEPEPLTEPVFLSSVYRFEDLEQVDAVWEGRRTGFVYRRFGHSNAATLERLAAGLEGAEEAVACSSGMAALLAALLAHVRSGQVVVAQAGLYGGTRVLLAEHLSRLGVELVCAARPEADAFREVIARLGREGRSIAALLVESISNPVLEVAELDALGELAQAEGLLLVVDNTFATPLGCRPLTFGPALVIHSATKYLGGHADVSAGLVAGPRDLVAPCRAAAVSLGATVSPLDAWLTVRGLRTLHLRFARQQATAAAVASWLEGRPGVERVLYPGLPSHPTHGRALRVLEGPGAVVSFELTGGEDGVARLVRRLRLISFAPSLGDPETTIMYPARTSHRALCPEELREAGVGPGLVRLSAGLEDVHDILADLEQALTF